MSKLRALIRQWKNKRWLKNYSKKPKRCIDPVMKYCQECRWGYVHYPDWVETYADTIGCTFESGCTLGLEDTEPTKRELRKFDREIRKYEKNQKEASRSRKT